MVNKKMEEHARKLQRRNLEIFLPEISKQLNYAKKNNGVFSFNR